MILAMLRFGWFPLTLKIGFLGMGRSCRIQVDGDLAVTLMMNLKLLPQCSYEAVVRELGSCDMANRGAAHF